MCGIIGVLSGDFKESLKRSDWFNQALYTDALRGWDSTGIFAVAQNHHIDIFKKGMTASDFMDMKPYNTILNKYNQNDFLIGHNCKATKGRGTHHNAHPINYDDSNMVNHGTLCNHQTLPDGNHFFEIC